MKHTLLSTVALAVLPSAGLADEVFTEDVIIDSNLLCVGTACTDGEDSIPSARAGLKVKDINGAIRFEDTTVADDFPKRSWQLSANEEGSQGQEAFFLSDLTEGTTPLWVSGAAPSNALSIQDNGSIGINTALPQADLHVVTNFNAAKLRLEERQGTPGRWDLVAGNSAFAVINGDTFQMPFRIQYQAPTGLLELAANGNVGIGTGTPEAPLEISDDDTFSFFRITATDAPINQSADVVFTEGPLRTGEFRYNIVDGDGPEMRLNADGDMVLSGTLTTAGPTCAAGCDAVFEPDYDRLSIAEHASEMWAKGYLPAVGPTTPGAPLNVAEKLGAVLNELEHAHIYIEQVHEDLVDQQARLDRQDRLISSLLQRLEKVEQM
ncbi:MAG: hypothetical protein RIA08_19070 [Roseovarius sp.]|uniref:hypothetical protein n=1 Tax=Roseovarius sp. TaxID=1486281 RepID=UPI0032EBE4FD